MRTDYSPTEVMDRESRSNRYYRNAVERHWDPAEIELDADRENLLAWAESHGEEARFMELKDGLAKFGAGEEAVTEDLAPLGVVLEDIDDQMFLTTQLYEEAKHADFFERYWSEVVRYVEDEMGWENTSPKDDRWFNEPYVELFDRNRKAMHRLLEDGGDTPENRAKAYCHYHLTIEGILAQTGYYGMQTSYGGGFEALPHLPGLVEGFSNIRSDEGRHVGFGMSQLKSLIADGLDPSIIDDTVNELMPLVNGITGDQQYDDSEAVGVGPDRLAEYAIDKHAERMEQIKDAARDIPDVDDLVRLESDD
ncbi:MAG: ribonucleoside-diphosphate reductase [Haloarculaceae archaeon]